MYSENKVDRPLLEVLSNLCAEDEAAYQYLSACLINKTGLDNSPAASKWLYGLIEQLENLARQGKTAPMVLLGNAYLNGWTVEKDISKALNHARHAASLGSSGGEVLLGFMYANGHGVVKDYSRAMQWFEKALAKGHSMAANNIGAMYEYGLSVKQNLTLALKYYKQAAEKQNTLAIQNLERLQNLAPAKKKPLKN